MTGNPVGWFEIYVEDMSRARAFYESVLNVRLEQRGEKTPGVDEMMMFPAQKGGEGASGALVKMQGGPSPGAGTIVYFSCDDCAVEAARVRGGGKVMKEKFSIGQYGFIALATDTEGNAFGLHSLK